MSAEVENATAVEVEPKAEKETVPSWVEKELKSVRDEAAAHRVKLRAAESQLADRDAALAELNEKLTASVQVESQLTDVQKQITQLRAALTAGVPANDLDSFTTLASRLQGDSEDAMVEDAKSILGLVGHVKTGPKPDLSQGRGNANALGTSAFEDILRAKLGL